jgi:hypothetical protein
MGTVGEKEDRLIPTRVLGGDLGYSAFSCNFRLTTSCTVRSDVSFGHVMHRGARVARSCMRVAGSAKQRLTFGGAEHSSLDEDALDLIQADGIMGAVI